MPSRTNSNGATPTSQPARRFELPVLDFKFAPLTEGTNIPPPLPSPVEEEPPRVQTPAVANNANGHDDEGSNHSSEASPNSAGVAKTGTKRPADSPISPVSPTSSTRPGSIRRLFSRNLLNASYVEGEGGPETGARPQSAMDIRPDSRSNSIMTDGKRSKRGSGWFRRLRGSDGTESRRGSLLFEESKRTSGPPPPMIPELRDLEAKVDLNNDSSFSDDLFKNIK